MKAARALSNNRISESMTKAILVDDVERIDDCLNAGASPNGVIEKTKKSYVSESMSHIPNNSLLPLN
jgi:hypothetical protein